jgi:hypothetical protein
VTNVLLPIVLVAGIIGGIIVAGLMAVELAGKPGIRLSTLSGVACHVTNVLLPFPLQAVLVAGIVQGITVDFMVACSVCC